MPKALVIDAALMRHERLNFHPLVNTRTTNLSRSDFLKFLDAVGHTPTVLTISD